MEETEDSKESYLEKLNDTKKTEKLTLNFIENEKTLNFGEKDYYLINWVDMIIDKIYNLTVRL